MSTPATLSPCLEDLDFAATFLLANDAGIRAAGWTRYPDHVAEALDAAREIARQATDTQGCAEAIRHFLKAIRRHHLTAIPVSDDAMLWYQELEASTVVARRLSDRTTYIDVPSFHGDTSAQLVQLIERNEGGLREAPYLIIDLRKNGGGFSSAFRPLLKLFGQATYDYDGLNPEVYVTTANTAAWEAIVPVITNPDDIALVASVIDRMKSADKEWIPAYESGVPPEVVSGDSIKADPTRVALLIGCGCGSACEEFVFTARQNPRIVLMGRRTAGAMDASNLREAKTPSGRISLLYASTFVRRPPGQEIDGIGIAPHLELPLPADRDGYDREVEWARAWLEN